jgi:TetR/AcrR family transcriptional regulator, cholesterol catabolism regulator
MADAMQRVADQGNPLAEVVRAYLLVCDRMNDHILLIYQETQSLPHKWRRVVLENEVRITGLFTRALTSLMADGKIPLLSEAAMDLVAHNIAVIGHMWTFRRWFLSRHYTIDDYIRHQTAFILNMCHTEEPVPDRRPGYGNP